MQQNYIDMHTHTIYSDGELSPNNLIKEAYENNIPKVKMKKGIELYLNSRIEMMESSSTSIISPTNIISSNFGHL